MPFTKKYIKKIFEEYKQDFIEMEHYDRTREKLWKCTRLDITMPLRTIKRLKALSKERRKPVSNIIGEAVERI